MDARTKQTFSNPYYFLALGGGSGLSPGIPGTVGSAAAIPFFLLFSRLGYAATLGIILLSIPLGIMLCQKVAANMDSKDPACIVFDEFVGMWIAMFMLPLTWYWIFLAFVLFRIFDVLKPGPVGWCDKNLKGGVGIMLDDVLAGLITFAIMQILITVFA